MAEHIAAATGTLALVAAMVVGLGSLIFGSPRGLWRAVVLAFTENPDA